MSILKAIKTTSAKANLDLHTCVHVAAQFLENCLSIISIGGRWIGSSAEAMSANAWIAAATVIYALATGGLAYFTNKASIRAVEAGLQNTKAQVAADSENIQKQIEASADAVNKQVASAKDSAIIQARASSISNNRQQWINSLRDEVTSFLTDLNYNIVVSDMRLSDEREAEQLKISRSLKAHVFKVRLLLNPLEAESNQLVEMMTAGLQNGLPLDQEEALVSHLQAILKTEWKRVKSGE